MVVDRDPQTVLAVYGRVRDGSDAVLLQPQHDFDIEMLQGDLIEASRTIPKANDVDGRARDTFQETALRQSICRDSGPERYSDR